MSKAMTKTEMKERIEELEGELTSLQNDYDYEMDRADTLEDECEELDGNKEELEQLLGDIEHEKNLKLFYQYTNRGIK